MTRQKQSFDEYDELFNPRSAISDFHRVAQMGLSRQGFLSGLLVFRSGARKYK